MVHWADEHDWKKYPELTKEQNDNFGFMSPHPQIMDDFEAEVVKVIDGDTIKLKADFRDFVFPCRLGEIDAPELQTGSPGEEARDFLKGQIEGQTVLIKINKGNKVDKYGRLLGDIVIGGQDMGSIMIMFGHAKPFHSRYEGDIPDFNKELRSRKWF